MGLKRASVPFDLAADFIPDLLRSSDRKLEAASASPAPEAPEYADIIHRSRVMQRTIAKATYVPPRSVPVLLKDGRAHSRGVTDVTLKTLARGDSNASRL